MVKHDDKTVFISGNSMEPALMSGDQVAIVKEDFSVGDIVAYYSSCCSNIVVHRVLAVFKNWVFTVGDNNFFPDKRVLRKKVIGKVYLIDENNKLSSISVKNRHPFVWIVHILLVYLKILIRR